MADYIKIYTCDTGNVTLKYGNNEIMLPENTVRLLEVATGARISIVRATNASYVSMGTIAQFEEYPSGLAEAPLSVEDAPLVYKINPHFTTHQYTAKLAIVGKINTSITFSGKENHVVWAAKNKMCEYWRLGFDNSTQTYPNFYPITDWGGSSLVADDMFNPYVFVSTVGVSTIINCDGISLTSPASAYICRWNSDSTYYYANDSIIHSQYETETISIGENYSWNRWISIEATNNSSLSTYATISIPTEGHIKGVWVGETANLLNPAHLLAGPGWTHTFYNLTDMEQLYLAGFEFDAGYYHPVAGYPCAGYPDERWWDITDSNGDYVSGGPIDIRSDWNFGTNRDIVLYATAFQTCTYRVFNNVGAVKHTDTVGFGDVITTPTPALYNITEPDSNYVFYGWATALGSLNKAFDSNVQIVVSDYATGNELNLYPIWKKDVIVDEDISNPLAGYYNNGYFSVNLPSPPTISGWVFKGWSYIDPMTIAGFSNPVNSNPMYLDKDEWYTSYSRSVTVRYDGNGGTSSRPPASLVFTQFYRPGYTSGTNTSSYPVRLSENRYTKENYNFNGWNTNPSATSGTAPGVVVVVNPSASSSNSVVYYATWVANVVNITYHPNYTGGPANHADSVTPGVATTVWSGSTWSRTGYKLIGWNTADDGSGTPYPTGSSITVNAATDLYAVWYELFEWTSDDSTNIVAGKPTTNALASKFNELQNKVHDYINNSYIVNNVSSGNKMTATAFNGVRAYLTSVSSVTAGNPISAQNSFIAIKNALNNNAHYII